MGDNDPIDACEIGTMVSLSLIIVNSIYLFIYLVIIFITGNLLFSLFRQESHAWGRHGVLDTCAFCQNACLALHIHIVLAFACLKNVPVLLASLLLSATTRTGALRKWLSNNNVFLKTKDSQDFLQMNQEHWGTYDYVCMVGGTNLPPPYKHP